VVSPLNPWTYRPPGRNVSNSTRFPNDNYPEPSCTQHWSQVAEGMPEFAKWHFAPPNSSSWLDFNASALCQKLIADAHVPGKPRILFVGESMSHNQMLELMLALQPFTTWRFTKLEGRPRNVTPDDWLPTNVSGMTKNQGASACNGSLWIQQTGSQSLYADYTGEFVFKEHIPWIRSFDVVVLQVPWGRVAPENLLETVEFWRSSLLPRQKLFLRTSTIGHEHTGPQYNHSWDPGDISPLVANLSQHAPFRSPEEVVRFYATMAGHPSWYALRQDMEQKVSTLEQNGTVIADIYYLTAMMWDWHRDPLHYCVPGPLGTTWNDILYNYLMRGHIRDFQAWARNFSQAVKALGGLRSKDDNVFQLSGKSHVR